MVSLTLMSTTVFASPPRCASAEDTIRSSSSGARQSNGSFSNPLDHAERQVGQAVLHPGHPPPGRVLSSVGGNPSFVRTPSTVNPPRRPTGSARCKPTRTAVSRMAVQSVPGGSQNAAAPNIPEPVSGGWPQCDHLTRPQGHDLMREDHTLDAAGNSLQEGHDADPVAVSSEEGGCFGEVVLISDPSQILSSSVEHLPGVSSPCGSATRIEFGRCGSQARGLSRHHTSRCPPDPRSVP
jgi:hypothetical protein